MPARRINVILEAFAGRWENLEVNFAPTPPDLLANSSLMLFEPAPTRSPEWYRRDAQRRRREWIRRAQAQARAEVLRLRREQEAREAESDRIAGIWEEYGEIVADLREHRETQAAIQEALDTALASFGENKPHDPHNAERLSAYESLMAHYKNARQASSTSVRVYDICLWFTIGVPPEVRAAFKRMSEYYHEEAGLMFDMQHITDHFQSEDPICSLCENRGHFMDETFFAVLSTGTFGIGLQNSENGFSDYVKTYTGWKQVEHIRKTLDTRMVRLLHAPKEDRWPFTAQDDATRFSQEEHTLSVDGQLFVFAHTAGRVLSKQHYSEAERIAWERIDSRAQDRFTPEEKARHEASKTQLERAEKELLKELIMLEFCIKQRYHLINKARSNLEQAEQAIKLAPPLQRARNQGEVAKLQAANIALVRAQHVFPRACLDGVQVTRWKTLDDEHARQEGSALVDTVRQYMGFDFFF